MTPLIITIGIFCHMIIAVAIGAGAPDAPSLFARILVTGSVFGAIYFWVSLVRWWLA